MDNSNEKNYLHNEKNICIKCENEVILGSKYCHHCGKKIILEPSKDNLEPSKDNHTPTIVTVIICALLILYVVFNLIKEANTTLNNKTGKTDNSPTTYCSPTIYKSPTYVATPNPNIYVDRNPKIGMTKSEVLNSTWGKPEDVNTTTTKYGTNEQWVYSLTRYIYFDNGIVTAIQD